jgi:hypothetical protein
MALPSSAAAINTTKLPKNCQPLFPIAPSLGPQPDCIAVRRLIGKIKVRVKKPESRQGRDANRKGRVGGGQRLWRI